MLRKFSFSGKGSLSSILNRFSSGFRRSEPFKTSLKKAKGAAKQTGKGAAKQTGKYDFNPNFIKPKKTTHSTEIHKNPIKNWGKSVVSKRSGKLSTKEKLGSMIKPTMYGMGVGLGATAMTGYHIMSGMNSQASDIMLQRYMNDTRYTKTVMNQNTKVGRGTRNTNATKVGNHLGLSLSLNKLRHG